LCWLVILLKKKKRKIIVLGNVQYRNLRSGEMIDCNQLFNGQLIIDEDIEIIETEHRITFILVVEKDTVFQVV
jgi:DNA topoisomerase VI subunit A